MKFMVTNYKVHNDIFGWHIPISTYVICYILDFRNITGNLKTNNIHTRTHTHINTHTHTETHAKTDMLPDIGEILHIRLKISWLHTLTLVIHNKYFFSKAFLQFNMIWCFDIECD